MPSVVPEIAVRDWAEEPVLAMNATSQRADRRDDEYEELPDTWAELVSSGAMSGLVAAYSKAAGSPAP